LISPKRGRVFSTEIKEILLEFDLKLK